MEVRTSTVCWNRWPVEPAEPPGWCLMERWTAGCDDHDRLVLVDVVHDRFDKGLDLEAGDVPHVHRCEMLVENCDALGVDFPTHRRKAKLAASLVLGRAVPNVVPCRGRGPCCPSGLCPCPLAVGSVTAALVVARRYGMAAAS